MHKPVVTNDRLTQLGLASSPLAGRAFSFEAGDSILCSLIDSSLIDSSLIDSSLIDSSVLETEILLRNVLGSTLQITDNTDYFHCTNGPLSLVPPVRTRKLLVIINTLYFVYVRARAQIG